MNHLDRQFERDAPNQAWVTDITYIRTGEGWRYLVAILDFFSRRVVGWETSDRMDASFCRRALEKVLKGRQPSPGLRPGRAVRGRRLPRAPRGLGVRPQHEPPRHFWDSEKLGARREASV